MRKGCILISSLDFACVAGIKETLENKGIKCWEVHGENADCSNQMKLISDRMQTKRTVLHFFEAVDYFICNPLTFEFSLCVPRVADRASICDIRV